MKRKRIRKEKEKEKKKKKKKKEHKEKKKKTEREKEKGKKQKPLFWHPLTRRSGLEVYALCFDEIPQLLFGARYGRVL
jgi:aspartate carbamoyltransferase catalytic subunit